MQNYKRGADIRTYSSGDGGVKLQQQSEGGTLNEIDFGTMLL